MKKVSAPGWPLRILRVLLICALAVLTALVIVSGLLNTLVFNETVYTSLADDPAFMEEMTGYVHNNLEAQCLFYDLPLDAVLTDETEKVTDSVVRTYLSDLRVAILDGTPMKTVEIDPAPYKNAVDAFFATLPEQKRPLDEAASQTIAEDLAKTTSMVLQGGMGERLITLTHRLLMKKPVRLVADHFKEIAIAAAVCFVLLCVLSFAFGIRLQAYAILSAFFVGSAATFIPILLFRGYDLLPRLIIGESPLKVYVSYLYTAMMERAFSLTMLLFIVTGVLLLAAIVWRVWPKKEDTQTACPENLP